MMTKACVHRRLKRDISEIPDMHEHVNVTLVMTSRLLDTLWQSVNSSISCKVSDNYTRTIMCIPTKGTGFFFKIFFIGLANRILYCTIDKFRLSLEQEIISLYRHLKNKQV